MTSSVHKLRAAGATAVTVGACIVALGTPALGAPATSPSPVAHDTVCPGSVPETVVSPRDGATTALVPDGSKQLMLCRYGTLTGTGPAALAAQKLVQDQSTVNGFATNFNGLPAPPAGPVACPDDNGSEIVAYFRYASDVDNPVTVDLSGCEGVSNGYVNRTAAGTGLVGRLEAVVPVVAPPPRDATIKGYVQRCGGPAPGGCRVTTFTSCSSPSHCVTADRVAVYRDHMLVTRVRLHRARFRVALQAGRYTLKLLGDGEHVTGRVLETAHATARARHTTKIVFGISVP